ncbi:MAG: hypothetical protein CVV14_08725 [Gammaproteobacteria bacterium HGW-Gammaproteobacteria-4]|jgi:hypothetical protein|nr:MAG: hypothetical protein CVV14_08725 [Gammaproteobacteria bacterium HGW-Gammaproteobacteria-4]
MKISTFLGTGLLFAACASASEQKAYCDVDPVIFCAPFEQLAAALTEQDKERLLRATPVDIVLMHHGFGMGIRNRFGLWRDNELTRFFKSNGVDHPDSMSGPFISGFIGYLEGQPVVMTQEIEKHQPPPPPPPPLPPPTPPESPR